MSPFGGALLIIEAALASFWAATGDWAWFAVACVGCFVIWALDSERGRS